MADNVVRTFQQKHGDDIAAADSWAAEAGYAENQRPSTIIQWFAAMDTNILTERIRTIEQLGSADSPFDHVFSLNSGYQELSDAWNTGDAEAFFRYCGDGTNGGLSKYLTELKATANNHYQATGGYRDSIDSLIVGVRTACDDHIANFKEELGWFDFKVLFGLTDPWDSLENFLEAVVTAADTFEGHVTSLDAFTEMMGPDWVPTVGEDPYRGEYHGPEYSDGIDPDDHIYGPTNPHSLTGESARSEDEIPGGENYNDPNDAN